MGFIDIFKDEHKVIKEKLIRLGRSIELAPSKPNESLTDIKEILSFFTESLFSHFRNEEDLHISNDKKSPNSDQVLQMFNRVKKEHEIIINEIQDFKEEVTKMENAKLFCDGIAINGMKLLHDLGDHIRFEENNFFPSLNGKTKVKK
ncbi:MAG: hemerythrin domain-containing protein [Thermoplasmata archaeon]